MEELLTKWKARLSCFRAEAELAFFAQNGINKESIEALDKQHYEN